MRGERGRGAIGVHPRERFEYRQKGWLIAERSFVPPAAPRRRSRSCCAPPTRLRRGATWIEEFSYPLGGTPRRVFFADTLRGWIVGGGLLLRTVNGGYPWTPVTQYPGYLPVEAAASPDGETIWAVGANGLILRLRVSPTYRTYLPLILDELTGVQSVRAAGSTAVGYRK